MLSSEILTTAQQHAESQTLSAYVPIPPDVNDPAEFARIALRNGLAAVAQTLRSASHADRESFDSCSSRMTERFAAMTPLAGHVWIAFATAKGEDFDVAFLGALPPGVEPVIAWDMGPRLAPLMALSEGGPAVLVLADHERAAFLHVDHESGVHELERFETHAKVEVGEHMNAPPKMSFHQGTHGTPATDSAARQAAAAYGRHCAQIVDKMGLLPGAGAIFLGGAAETTAHIMDALPPLVRDRTTIARDIQFSSTVPEMQTAITELESSVRATEQRRLVDENVARALSTRVGALGLGPAQSAIEQSAVDTLLLSADLLRTDPDGAEKLVRGALQQHAKVHVVTGDAAGMLNEAAAGVAVRLRYPVAALSDAPAA